MISRSDISSSTTMLWTKKQSLQNLRSSVYALWALKYTLTSLVVPGSTTPKGGDTTKLLVLVVCTKPKLCCLGCRKDISCAAQMQGIRGLGRCWAKQLNKALKLSNEALRFQLTTLNARCGLYIFAPLKVIGCSQRYAFGAKV